MNFLISGAIILILIAAAQADEGQSFSVVDSYVPDHCDNIAQTTDHLLLEYKLRYDNGSEVNYIKSTGQLFYVKLDVVDDLQVLKGLKGMCQNATRTLIWNSAKGVNLSPLLIQSNLNNLDEKIEVEIKLQRITTQSDYQIFDALKNNFSRALDLFDEQKGINAHDEWGQTPLMIAVSNQYTPIIAGLLNARKPKVDINVAKPSGYTALHYAVEKANLGILQALLRRGADPNARITQEGSKGNTPLHFACLLEKVKHAEALLEYASNPLALNEHGQSPLQLLPNDAVRSTKLHFKRLFDEAILRMQTQLSDSESVWDGSGAEL